MECASEWVGKPAIVWDHSTIQDATCSYWDSNVLSTLEQLRSEFRVDETKLLSSISYESLLMLTVVLVESLRAQLIDSLTSMKYNKCDNILGFPVVVAIPEGPLLPIAVFVVSVMNEPLDSNISAVLVPIEPTEGKERLRHMLNNVKPVVVLAMPGSDLDLINDILSTISYDEVVSVKTQDLFRPTFTLVIDFMELILESIDLCKDKCGIVPKQSVAQKEQSFRNLVLECLVAKPPTQNGVSSLNCDCSNRISHIVFTSGTTGQPKGCVSSIRSLQHYIQVKNECHEISSNSSVLLASALSFDPCLSDILATFEARATLAIAPRQQMLYNMPQCVKSLHVTHVLCTPSLWSLVHNSGAEPSDFPLLQVIALGGEPIPKRMIAKWARSKFEASGNTTTTTDNHPCKLFATYGVTEACVYQTYGEVFKEPHATIGPHVGIPFRGLGVHLCDESDQNQLQIVSDHGGLVGEVVLFGAQLDEWSSYLNLPEQSSQKFIRQQVTDGEYRYYYRTGDRGSYDASTRNLRILGRINGATGMVKINGVRIELGEIEAAVVDDVSSTLPTVVDAMAVAIQCGEEDMKQIHLFCVLGQACLDGMEFSWKDCTGIAGAICTSGPLLALLQARCESRAKVSPSVFVIVPRIPLSPTGKRDGRKLPALSQCFSLESLTLAIGGDKPTPLQEYGKSGKVVTESIVECLNLQPCQQVMLTTAARFAFLGGDSLAATRVVRALFAYHHNVFNTRHLGGEYGTLDGPFNVIHLLKADSLKDYVDWLDSNGVCKPHGVATEESPSCAAPAPQVEADNSNGVGDENDRHSMRMYTALIEAATSGNTAVAIALLDIGADPNLDFHGGRLGKISDRKERRQMFRSSPLHIACVKGDHLLVEKILQNGGKYNTPDASGSFPIHLAASGTSGYVLTEKEARDEHSADEDRRRLECVRLLLDAGAPLSMKDGNKQTVLHCAARSGHCELISFIMDRWKAVWAQNELTNHESTKSCREFDWTDRWFRTPVHWAILNKHVEALRILLENGCNPNPPKTTKNKQTSAAVETPSELCSRLYSKENEAGKEISRLLRKFM